MSNSFPIKKKDTFQKARKKRTELCIMRRLGKGEKPETSKKLAELMDKLYGLNLTKRYHSN